MTTTVLDIVTLALKDCGALGVGQTALPEDANDAFTKLNWMLAQWNRKRWLVYHLIDKQITSTGAQFYSIGPSGADITMSERPDKLESAFFRQLVQSQPNQIDYPLEILQSHEDYNNIALKSLVSFPSYVFYNPAYPNGNLFPWPIPQPDIYALWFTFKEILAQFTSLAQVIVLPTEYMAALHYNLVIRLYPQYSRADPTFQINVQLAKDSLNVIRESYTAISRLQMPTDLVRPGIYNPYSDQIR